jgi:hypothetical protein
MNFEKSEIQKLKSKKIWGQKFQSQKSQNSSKNPVISFFLTGSFDEFQMREYTTRNIPKTTRKRIFHVGVLSWKSIRVEIISWKYFTWKN